MAVDKVITRWRAHCELCGFVTSDLLINKRAKSTGDTTTRMNFRKHLMAHVNGKLDPAGTDAQAQCPVCAKVLKRSAEDERRKLSANHKLLYHFVTRHPKEADEWFARTGIPAPRMEKIEVPRDSWAEESRRMGEEEQRIRKEIRRPKKQAARARSVKRRRERRKSASRTRLTDENPATEDSIEPTPVVLPPVDFSTYRGAVLTGSAVPQRGGSAVTEKKEMPEVPSGGGNPQINPGGQTEGDPPPAPRANRNDDFGRGSLIDHLRGGRLARARAAEEEEEWGSAERAEEESDLHGEHFARPLRSRRRPTDDEDAEEGGRGGRRTKEGVGNFGKVALLAVLGLAAAGAGLLLWCRMRGKAGAGMVPVGDLLPGGQGGRQPPATPQTTAKQAAPAVPVQQTGAVGPLENKAEIPPSKESGVIVLPGGRGVVGMEYADRAHRFL